MLEIPPSANQDEHDQLLVDIALSKAHNTLEASVEGHIVDLLVQQNILVLNDEASKSVYESCKQDIVDSYEGHYPFFELNTPGPRDARVKDVEHRRMRKEAYKYIISLVAQGGCQGSVVEFGFPLGTDVAARQNWPTYEDVLEIDAACAEVDKSGAGSSGSSAQTGTDSTRPSPAVGPSNEFLESVRNCQN